MLNCMDKTVKGITLYCCVLDRKIYIWVGMIQTLTWKVEGREGVSLSSSDHV